MLAMLCGCVGGRTNRRSSPAKRVRRRVNVNRFLRAFFFDFSIAAALFVVFLLVHQLVATPLDSLAAHLWIFGGLVGVAFIVSVVRAALFGRESLFGAALTVDEALRLKERISSALHMQERASSRASGGDAAQTVAWRQLIERDGAESLANVDVRTSFPVHLPPSAGWACAFLVIAVVIATAVPQQDLFGWHSERETDERWKDEVEHEIEDLAKSEDLAALEELAQESQDPELKEIIDAVNELHDPTKKSQDPQAVKPEADRGDEAKTTALAKMSEIQDLIEKQVAKAEFEKLNEFLDTMRLSRISSGAVSKAFQKALKDGDLSAAAKELSALRDKLKELAAKQRAGKLTKEERELLEQLKKEMSALAGRSSLLSQLGSGLPLMPGGLSPKQLQQMMRNMEQMNMDLKSLAQMMRRMQSLQRTLSALQAAKNNMATMHKCKNCGKLRKGPMRPGGT